MWETLNWGILKPLLERELQKGFFWRRDTSNCHLGFLLFHFLKKSSKTPPPVIHDSIFIKKRFFEKETPPSVIIYFCCSIILSHWGKHSYIQMTDDPANEWVKQLYQDEFVKINYTDLLDSIWIVSKMQKFCKNPASNWRLLENTFNDKVTSLYLQHSNEQI